MKTYFNLISYLQEIMLGIGILFLLILPPLLAFFPDTTAPFEASLYNWSHYALLFVMSIRPLSDLLTFTKWLRPLVILRKGFGVFSASIIVSFIFAKIIVDPGNYFGSFLTTDYWSLNGYVLFAHLADISAFLLLITSNKLSKQLLGRWWKRLQRLSYVYFFGSSLFLYLAYNDQLMLYYMIFIAGITLAAFFKNHRKRRAQAQAKIIQSSEAMAAS